MEAHLDDYPDYCILNLCRLIYSFATRDVVVSKARAADWAWDAFPQWREALEVARRSYAGQATLEEKTWMKSEARGLFSFAGEQIRESQAQER